MPTAAVVRPHCEGAAAVVEAEAEAEGEGDAGDGDGDGDVLIYTAQSYPRTVLVPCARLRPSPFAHH